MRRFLSRGECSCSDPGSGECGVQENRSFIWLFIACVLWFPVMAVTSAHLWTNRSLTFTNEGSLTLTYECSQVTVLHYFCLLWIPPAAVCWGIRSQDIPMSLCQLGVPNGWTTFSVNPRGRWETSLEWTLTLLVIWNWIRCRTTGSAAGMRCWALCPTERHVKPNKRSRGAVKEMLRSCRERGSSCRHP